ncbi:ATP synthase subunit b' [Rickettsiales endosymbiont of Paramecium tredecaurelia]|uniref:F0F1 ATP synthase subunit B family protein n=1 Tax=Candidatus Sarmatiella mevalonica TaxID=2770581 RepID=UPI0019249E90|nr:hypothetical protein [Candidatus Sarmatiella mevalonica]MBL3284203.1 ATP synthase subunit b' [Candidatus Sarmatiella mevalonica]
MLPQLEIEYYPSQIFWLLVVFVFLYALIRFCIVPRLQKVFKARSNAMQDLIDQTRSLVERAQELRSIRSSEYLDLQSEVQIISEEANKALEKLGAARKLEFNKWLEELEADYGQQMNKTLTVFENKKTDYAFDLAQLLLKQMLPNVDATKLKQYIETK